MLCHQNEALALSYRHTHTRELQLNRFRSNNAYVHIWFFCLFFIDITFFFTHIFKNHIWFHTFHTLWSIKGESNILKSGGKKCKYQIDKWITWTVLNFLSAYKKLSTIRRHVCCWFIKTKIISLLCYLHLFIHFLHEPFTAVVPTVGWGTLLGVVNQMKGRERETICFQFQQFI